MKQGNADAVCFCSEVRADRCSYLRVFEEPLLYALLQLSGRMRVAAHSDDDFDSITVIQGRWSRPRTRGVYQNHFDFIRTKCFLFLVHLWDKAEGRLFL